MPPVLVDVLLDERTPPVLVDELTPELLDMGTPPVAALLEE
jgi:hypothetical protein